MEYKFTELSDWITVEEPAMVYNSEQYPHSEITHNFIGACFDVYNTLGKGFSEIIYKDALEDELGKRNVRFNRERKFEVAYKDIILKHYFFADFVIEDKIILEIKAQQGIVDDSYTQVLNYLAVSKCKVGLLVNFGENSLKYKRLIL